MGKILNKPCTKKEREFFIVEENHRKNNLIIENEDCIFSLEKDEIVQNGKIVKDPEFEAKQEIERQKQLNMLTMTALDFITVLNQAGFTIQDRQQYFAKHPEVQEQLMYCQNVYCGIVRQLCPITINNKTVTDEMVVNAFRTKAGEIKGGE